LTKAQSEKRKVKSESAKRKRVLTPLLNFALSISVSTVKDHRLSSAVQASRTLIAEHAWEQRAAMQILHDDRAFLFQSRSGMVTI